MTSPAAAEGSPPAGGTPSAAREHLGQAETIEAEGLTLAPTGDRQHHDGEDGVEQAHAERRRMPNRGAVVFRARPKWTVPGLIVGGLVGALIASGGGMLLGAGIGALVGSRLRRSVCSGPRCGAPLDADATQCSKCGGTVVGVIERTKDHLGALEDYEERQLALEAEP